MTLHSFVCWLGLAGTIASAWPQNPEGSSSTTLPFSVRSLPSVDEVEGSGTLHLPAILPRGLPVVDEDETEFTLPVGLKRHLPTEQDLPHGVLTLPVIHAMKPSLVGRSVEVQLENRSDVAYYAQRKFKFPMFL